MSDLLMTKLQVVEIEDRDYKDIVRMLVHHELGDSDAQDTINKNYIAGVFYCIDAGWLQEKT